MSTDKKRSLAARLVRFMVAAVVIGIGLQACGDSHSPSLAVSDIGGLTESPPALPGESGNENFTTKVINLRVKVGPDKTTICNVLANLHRPDSATKDRPAPALIATNGFGGSKDDYGATGTNDELKQFAKHGYVGLSYSGLGFGGSDCLIYLDDPAWDGVAASQLAEFLGGKPDIAFEKYSYSNGQQVWSNPIAAVDYVKRDDARSGIANDPRVGMIGGSYGGAISYATAATDRRIDTIIPQETWSKLSYSLAPNNVDLNENLESPALGVAKKGWLSLFSAAGLSQPAQNSAVYRPDTTCPGFTPEACPAIANLSTVGYPDSDALAISHRTSAIEYADRINVPVYINQGVSDSLFNLHEGVALYQRLKQQGVPVKMQWMSWGHGGGNCLQPFPPGPPCAGSPVKGELDATQALEASYQGRMYLAWFDHWLKDSQVGTGAEFSYYRDWIAPPADGPNSAQYAEVPTGYPVARDKLLYLSGAATLIADKAKIDSGSAMLTTSADTTSSYSESAPVDRSAPLYDRPGTFVSFSTTALAADTDVVGLPILDVQLQASTFAATQSAGPSGQLILFAKIYDVAPDGTQVLPNRIVAPMRIADVSKRLRISLPALSHRFAKGHQLRVVLAQGDSAYAGNLQAGTVTISNSTAQPNTLYLPVVE